MMKKLVAAAATSAALLVGIVAMSGSADARAGHPGGHGHSHHMFISGRHHMARCVWRVRWHHHHRVNIRVCRAHYW